MTDRQAPAAGPETHLGSAVEETGTQRAARGAIITMTSRGVRLMWQFVGLIVLARYVNPADYGLLAMAGAFVGFAGLLGDFGVSVSALRRVSIGLRERDALFWFSTFSGCGLAVATVGVAPLVAMFYSENAVIWIMWALAPVFIVNGASAQYRVDAVRQGRFRVLAASDIVSSSISLVVAVVLAVRGFGYWALIAQTIIGAAIGAIILVWQLRWIPGRPARDGQLRGHLGFGSVSTFAALINYISTNTDSIALGRFLGPSSVGTYSRAYQLFSLPVDQITSPLTSVLLPVLARVDVDSLPAVLLRVQRCLAYLILGVCLVIAAGGTPLTALLLGGRFTGAGQLVQVLMAGAVFQISAYVYYWAFLTTDRMALLFWCEVPSRVLMTLMIIVGSAYYGTTGAAVGHTVGLFSSWLILTTVGVRRLGWKIMQFAVGTARPVCLYLVSFSLAAFVRESMRSAGNGNLSILAVTMAVLITCFGLALFVPVYRRDFCEMFGMLRYLRRP